jgi:hypothetical protein
LGGNRNRLKTVYRVEEARNEAASRYESKLNAAISVTCPATASAGSIARSLRRPLIKDPASYEKVGHTEKEPALDPSEFVTEL